MPLSRFLRPGEGARVARIGGIDIVLHPSWLFSLALLSLYAHNLIVAPVLDGSTSWRWIASIGLGAGLSGCILVHELAHCAVARGYGLPVRRITMFLFGGVSQIEREAPGPASEFHVAVAGPLASSLLAGVFALTARVLNPNIAGMIGVWGELAIFNLWVALFNMLPAFPMDGGRVLRSGLWAAFRSRARATRWAAGAGRSLAGALIAAGSVLAFVSLAVEEAGAPGGMWMVLLGLFLYNAAGVAGRMEGAEAPNERQPPQELL